MIPTMAANVAFDQLYKEQEEMERRRQPPQPLRADQSAQVGRGLLPEDLESDAEEIYVPVGR